MKKVFKTYKLKIDEHTAHVVEVKLNDELALVHTEWYGADHYVMDENKVPWGVRALINPVFRVPRQLLNEAVLAVILDNIEEPWTSPTLHDIIARGTERQCAAAVAVLRLKDDLVDVYSLPHVLLTLSSETWSLYSYLRSRLLDGAPYQPGTLYF